MKQLSALVTGANAGIGKYTALGLARQGVQVLLSGRNEKELAETKIWLTKETGNSDIDLFVADLSVMDQVVQLAAYASNQCPSLDILVNNAGIFLTTYQETKDGFETQWAVNYLAPFLLTNHLMPQLKAAHQARIVNVSSNGHLRGRIDFDDIQGRKKYIGLKAYAQSKLGNVLFTKQLAHDLLTTQITANALHPGVVSTGIGSKYNSGWISWIWNLAKPFMISEAKGAETSIYLALDPAVKTVSGAYYAKSKPAPMSDLGQDAALAKQLWTYSEQLLAPWLVPNP